MDNTNIGINITAKTRMATMSIHEFSESFVTLSKDGKRANTSLMGITKSLGSLSKVIRGIGLYKLSSGLAKAGQSAMDVRESVHMYNIAMGELAESTAVAVDKLSELSGLDRIKLLDTVGEYSLLARSMGMSAENASTLAENTNRLALDLGALTNRPFSKVSEDLRSGLIGQSKTLYKYGIDVTEASLKQEAMNQGISKSVRHMSQAEKMALRYAVIIRQTSLAHGDFANTINEPANQLRILSDRFVSLSRAIGNLFLPVLRTVLPWINAIVAGLTKVINLIAGLFGGTGVGKAQNEVVQNTVGGFGDIEDSIDDVGQSAGGTGGASEKVDKLKKKLQDLAGFDELNILGTPETPDRPSGGGGGGGGGGAGGGIGGMGDIDLGDYDSLFGDIKQKSDEILEEMEKFVMKLVDIAEPSIEAFKRLYEEGLKPLGAFTWTNLLSFYQKFLVPVGRWVLGEGLKQLFDILRRFLTDIQWLELTHNLGVLFGILAELTIFEFKRMLSWLENFLVPIASWVVGEGLNRFVEIMKAFHESIDWDYLLDAFDRFYTLLSSLTIFTFDAILDFYEHFLSPISAWVIGEGFPSFVDIMEKFAEAINWEGIKEGLIGVWQALLPFAETVGEGLLRFLEEVLMPIGEWVLNDVLVDFLEVLPDKINTLDGFMEEHGNTVFSVLGVWAGMKSVLPVLGGLFGGIIPTIKGFGGVIEIVGVVMEPFGSAISGLVGLFPTLTDVLSRVVPRFGEMQAPIESLAGRVPNLSGAFSLLGKLLGSGFIVAKVMLAIGAFKAIFDSIGRLREGTGLLSQIFEGSLGLAFNSIKESAMSVWEGFKNLWESISGLYEALSPLIDLIVVGLVGAFSILISTTVTVISKFLKFGMRIVEIVADLVSGVINFFTDLWKKIVGNSIVPDLVNDVTEWFTNMIDMVFGPVIELVKGVIEKYEELKTSVIDKVNELRESVTKVFNKLIKPIIDFASNLVKGVVDKYEEMKKNVSDKVEELKKAVTDKFNKLVKPVIDFARNIKDGVFDRFSEMWETVTGVVENLKDDISTTWDNIKTSISDRASNIVEAIQSPFNTAQEWITDFLKKPLQWGKNLINGFREGIQDRIGKLRETMSSVGEAISDKIGFKSPTKEGVGRYADEWMPNMMNMFSDGILEHNHKVESAIDVVGRTVSGVQDQDVSAGNKGSESEQSLVVNIGNTTVVDMLIDNIGRENRINGKQVISV